MEENTDDWLEKIEALEKAIKVLPVKALEAFYWAVENFDELEDICDDSDLALEELPDMMAKAWKEESYALFMLLCIAKTLKESKENEEI